MGLLVEANNKEIKWNMRPVKQREDLFYLATLAIVFLVINLVFLAAFARLFKVGHPRSLGFREIFITLLIIPPLSFYAFVLSHGDFEKKKKGRRLGAIFGSIFLLVAVAAHLNYSLKITNNIKVFEDVKNLENLNDTKVDFITTYYLAVYRKCCFFQNDAPTLLDCESKDFAAPCFHDNNLFESFQDGLAIADKKCYLLTKFDPYYSSARRLCKPSDEEFMDALGGRVYRALWVLSSVTLLSGWFTLWYAGEALFYNLGPEDRFWRY